MTAALSRTPAQDPRRNLYHNSHPGDNFYAGVQYSTVTENIVPFSDNGGSGDSATSAEDSENTMRRRKRADPDIADIPTVRLVEGPTPLVGRLQIYHRGHWRSVCTNSRK